MNTMQDASSWRLEYLNMKAGLTESQIRLLREGPTQLAQAWLLQAMHNDYRKLKALELSQHKEEKDRPSSEGQQT